MEQARGSWWQQDLSEALQFGKSPADRLLKLSTPDIHSPKWNIKLRAQDMTQAASQLKVFLTSPAAKSTPYYPGMRRRAIC